MEKKYQYIHKILPEKIDNQFVAFLDVMGFSNLVSQNNLEQLDRYFFHVNDILRGLKETNSKIDFLSISDSIIIVSPDGAFGLKQIIQTIKKIQLRLLQKKILLRGALAYGPVFFDNTNNILVGKGYIKAYKLESQAIYPRVIVDPSIVALLGEDRTIFIKTLNKDENLIYKNSGTSLIKDDAIFINYSEILDDGKIHRTVKDVYDMIKNNLYADQSIFEKYIWIKSYYLESLKKVEIESLHYNTKRAIEEWIEKFSRL
ncbi:hypothetical protein ACFOWA_19310 [Pedobacter lithocola]|uniref:Guanylate cyclase domain-containing protein n=1 Tax=Pedobacter lithocola TaxID=1908239 RepID=A0ABV8PE28_9SPHI